MFSVWAIWREKFSFPSPRHLLFECKSFVSYGVKCGKILDKALFCFTFNTTLGDFRLSVVAEKMKENKRSEKFQHQMRKFKKFRIYRLCWIPLAPSRWFIRKITDLIGVIKRQEEIKPTWFIHCFSLRFMFLLTYFHRFKLNFIRKWCSLCLKKCQHKACRWIIR